jgi:ABC-type sugar transport system ATPase subunit
MNESKCLLTMKGISKRFGAVTALHGVDLDLFPQEVLGLVGDNGAGKSTLIKVLSGVFSPDEGEILLDGERVQMKSPHEARDLGIETVYQDLALLDSLDVSKNLFIGREPRKGLIGGFLKVFYDWKEMQRRSQAVLSELGIEVPSVTTEVRNLSGGQRQAIAVGRAAFWGVKIVVLDEPTAALGVNETAKVLALVRRLKERGIATIMISHNLEHVLQVSDRVLVLRRGRNVAIRETRSTTGDEIVRLITGSDPGKNGEC